MDSLPIENESEPPIRRTEVDDELVQSVDEEEVVDVDLGLLCDPQEQALAGGSCMECICGPQGEVQCIALPDATACVADPNACTQGDSCLEGVCVAGLPADLEDGNPCTAGVCVKGSVEQTLLDGSCSDGDPCTVGDRCALGQCVPDALKECPSPPCRSSGWCDSSIGQCVYDYALDGSACGASDLCGASGQCQAGNCIYQQGNAKQGNACDDGDLCTVDQCDETGSCSHLPLECTEEPCQVLLACDPKVGGCTYAFAEDESPCEADGNCDLGGVCQAGTCEGDALLACNDGDPCTADSCDPEIGCVFDELTPCPVDGFATWNPLDKQEDVLLSNAMLTATVTQESVNNTLRATLPVTGGRWYWEITVEVAGDSGYNGICLADSDSWLEVAPGCSDPGLNYSRNGHYCLDSEFYFNGLSPYGAGSVVGVALDADAGQAYLRVGEDWLLGADPENLVGGLDLGFAPGTAIFPCINISQEDVYTANFGQHPFTYDLPDGFEAGPAQ